MRYGSFIQLWTTSYGSGRVMAFTDSTIFSNFCIFQPGKAEFFLGMIEWLNHSAPFDGGWSWWIVGLPFGLLGILLFVIGVRLVRHEEGAWLGLLTAGLFGLSLASIAVASAHRVAMPWPEATNPLKQIIVDREVSQVPLSKGAYVQGEGQGFGLLEQWIPRIGYFTARREGAEVTSGDGLIIICPTGSVDDEYRQQLVEYVENGGRLLVLDSPNNSESTANSLLWPFGLSYGQLVGPVGGKLTLPNGKRWPKVDVGASWTITGGEPLLSVDGAAVAAQKRFGKGTVTVIGFASAFNDNSMGGSWLLEPNEDMLRLYNLLFSLLEASFENRPIVLPAQAK
jgi:hypothetical protein